MNIRSAAIIGAGAVGAYFIWGLKSVPDLDLYLIAEGERAQRLKDDGVWINGEIYRLLVKTPEEAHEAPPDLIFLAVKYSSLAEAADEIRRAAGPATLVLSLMNGIDSEEVLAALIGEERVLPAFMRISSNRENNRITFDPGVTTGVFYGERDGNNDTDRMKALQELFNRSDVRHHPVTDIIRQQWEKYRANICYNLPQAILGVGYGAYFVSTHVEAIRAALEEEVVKCAAAEGIELLPAPDMTRKYPPDARYSTLQDLDAGRRTEVDMFLGVLIEKAAAHGITLPVSDTVFHIIKALEEKNEGIFAFELPAGAQRERGTS